MKKQVYDHYGRRCVCCGETNPKFLSIDHINGGGNKHRRRIGEGSDKIHRAIITEEFPEEYQVLCHNCNNGRSRNGGVCPHKEEWEVFDSFYG